MQYGLNRLTDDASHFDFGRVLVLDFEAVFDGVYPALFRYCHRLLGDADAADDVAQEAFVRYLDREIAGDPRGTRVWLFKVATHLIRDRARATLVFAAATVASICKI